MSVQPFNVQRSGNVGGGSAYIRLIVRKHINCGTAWVGQANELATFTELLLTLVGIAVRIQIEVFPLVRSLQAIAKI